MIQKKTVKSLVVVPILLCGMFAPAATAHGDLAMEFDTCVLRVGLNRVHFSGYQPGSIRQEFCEDIPAPGRTIIVLDYFDPVLREMQTEFRVIKDEGADENGNLDKVTLVHVPFARHGNGTFNFEYNFPQGRFIGLLTVKNAYLNYKARFPFAVGLNTGRSGNLVFYGLTALLFLMVVAYWFFNVYLKRQPATRSVVTAEGWIDEKTIER